LVPKLLAASYNNTDQQSTSNTLFNSTTATRFGLVGYLQENHSKYDKIDHKITHSLLGFREGKTL
jgi:hypothetical protein